MRGTHVPDAEFLGYARLYVEEHGPGHVKVVGDGMRRTFGIGVANHRITELAARPGSGLILVKSGRGWAVHLAPAANGRHGPDPVEAAEVPAPRAAPPAGRMAAFGRALARLDAARPPGCKVAVLIELDDGPPAGR